MGWVGLILSREGCRRECLLALLGLRAWLWEGWGLFWRRKRVEPGWGCREGCCRHWHMVDWGWGRCSVGAVDWAGSAGMDGAGLVGVDAAAAAAAAARSVE
jgi:hypothetical protein